MSAKLLNAAEQTVDVARIFAKQPAFEHQRIGRAGAVTHFAKSDDSLVGVYFDQCRGKWGADDLGHPHIGDAKLRWLGGRIDPIERLVSAIQFRHHGIFPIAVFVPARLIAISFAGV